jgi:hypothetical protein
MAYPPEFTIAYLVHGDLPVLDKVIPTSLAALCDTTRHSYDLLLVIDGAETAPVDELVDRAHHRWGFDEVRLRWRSRHRAAGDKTNNIHTHLFSDKSRFLITIEGDVAVFRDRDIDVLDHIAATFDRLPQLAVAQRIDDHDCWQWPLATAGPPLGPGVRSVNRVSSHFLIYDTARTRARIDATGGLPGDRFHDDGQTWFNYEDWLSQTFAAPTGPGIGFLDDIPLKVFHCDRKIEPGSAHYRRDLATRLAVFDQRQAETQVTGRG